MFKLLITTDLHQHPSKWSLLVKAVDAERPDFVLVAGDILPKYDGFGPQRAFFPKLRGMLDQRTTNLCWDAAAIFTSHRTSPAGGGQRASATRSGYNPARSIAAYTT